MINYKPIFSIIIPCYNSQNYVRNAVESVLKQTYKNLELVVVDDGSQDNTLQIISEYASNDARIKVLSKDNGGYPSAVNYGLDNISGDYFLVMGSDDELCLDLLENIVKTIDGYNPDMLVFKVKMHWMNNDKNDSIDSATLFDSEINFLGKYVDFYNKYKYEASFFALRDTGKIYKRNLLRDLRYFGSYGFDADGIFALLFAHGCVSFSVVPTVGYIWNLHNDSLSGKQLSSYVHLDRLNNWTLFIKFIKKIAKNELTDIDYTYSTIAHSIVCYFGSDVKKIFIRRYIAICKYYYHLRTLWFRKRFYRGLGVKKIVCSLFPFLIFFTKPNKR